MTTETRRQRLEHLMARLADGDRAAACALAVEFGGSIGAAVRSHLCDLGVVDVDRDEIDGLVIDVCTMLPDIAAAWRPDGGASPWHWARARVRTVVSSWVGQHADALDDSILDLVAPTAAPGREPDLVTVLDDLACRLPMVALVRDGLASVASARDRSILLEVAGQAVLGDPSPAITVATMYDLTPEAVRQVVSRTRRRLRRLAEQDERFAPLVDLPLAA